MKTRYIYTLSVDIQEKITNAARNLGYSQDEIEIMLNCRLCDLEDTLGGLDYEKH